MDLMRLIKITWKYKWLVVLGLIAGIYCAVWGYNQPRTIYETSVNLMIIDPQFSVGQGTERGMAGGISRAPTYAYLLTSQDVLRRANVKTSLAEEDMISAQAIPNTPIIKLRVRGNNPEGIRKLATDISYAFKDFLREEQAKRNVPKEKRFEVEVLGFPSEVKQLQSRKLEIAFIYFLAPLLLTFLLIAGLENLGTHRRKIKLIKDEEVKSAVDSH
jgi:uncharacterized protein involved in exopolysaccharide biosynthesis